MNIKEVTKTGNETGNETGKQEYKNNEVINFIIDILNDGYYETLNLFDMNIKNNIYIEIDLNIKDLGRLNIYNNDNLYEFLNSELDNYLYLDQYDYNIILLMDLLNIDLTDIYDIFEDSKDYIKAMQEIQKDTIKIFKDVYNLNNTSNFYTLSDFKNIIDVFYTLNCIDEYYYYIDAYNDLIINLKDEFIYNHNNIENLNEIDYLFIEDVYYSIFENYLYNIDILLYDTIKNKLDGFNKFNVNYQLDLY